MKVVNKILNLNTFKRTILFNMVTVRKAQTYPPTSNLALGTWRLSEEAKNTFFGTASFFIILNEVLYGYSYY